MVGGITPESAEAGCALYATFVKGEIIATDATTTEMVKLMENTTRDVNIAIANEFARLAEKSGVDVWEAISLANRHPAFIFSIRDRVLAVTASVSIHGSWWKRLRSYPLIYHGAR